MTEPSEIAKEAADSYFDQWRKECNGPKLSVIIQSAIDKPPQAWSGADVGSLVGVEQRL
jgi:hypothetical protein